MTKVVANVGSLHRDSKPKTEVNMIAMLMISMSLGADELRPFHLGVETGIAQGFQKRIENDYAGEPILGRGSWFMGPYWRAEIDVRITGQYLFNYSWYLALPFEANEHWDPYVNEYQKTLGIGNVLADEFGVSRRIGWSTVGIRFAMRSHYNGDKTSLKVEAMSVLIGPEFSTDLTRTSDDLWIRLRVGVLVGHEMGTIKPSKTDFTATTVQTNIGLTFATRR